MVSRQCGGNANGPVHPQGILLKTRQRKDGDTCEPFGIRTCPRKQHCVILGGGGDVEEICGSGPDLSTARGRLPLRPVSTSSQVVPSKCRGRWKTENADVKCLSSGASWTEWTNSCARGTLVIGVLYIRKEAATEEIESTSSRGGGFSRAVCCSGHR